MLATYEALLPLVGKHRLDMRHPALPPAADHLLGYQEEAGDLRGMYGRQYSPNYTAAILAVLLDAGARPDDGRIARACEWLLAIRQDDGGWTIPFRTRDEPAARGYNAVSRLAAPLEPDRAKPFSHFVTGVALRALVAHPEYRRRPETLHAARLLASRFFRPDRYADRRGSEYWEKLRYPFRWTDAVSALDAILRAGMPADEPEVAGALAWLAERQRDDGTWRSPYDRAADRRIHEWVSFAIARVLRLAGAI